MNGELSWVLFVRYTMKSQRDCGIIDPKSEEQGCKTWLHVYLLFVLFVIFNSFWITLKNIYIFYFTEGFPRAKKYYSPNKLNKGSKAQKKTTQKNYEGSNRKRFKHTANTSNAYSKLDSISTRQKKRSFTTASCL